MDIIHVYITCTMYMQWTSSYITGTCIIHYMHMYTVDSTSTSTLYTCKCMYVSMMWAQTHPDTHFQLLRMLSAVQ